MTDTGLPLAALQGVGGRRKSSPRLGILLGWLLKAARLLPAVITFPVAMTRSPTETTLSEGEGHFDSLFQRVQFVTIRTFKVLL